MAIGTTRDDGSQLSMWVVTGDLPGIARRPFGRRLNRISGQSWLRRVRRQSRGPVYTWMPTECGAAGSSFEGTVPEVSWA